jgi:hypothetical protein
MKCIFLIEGLFPINYFPRWVKAYKRPRLTRRNPNWRSHLAPKKAYTLSLHVKKEEG